MVGEKHAPEPVREAPGGALRWFAVAGEDRAWHRADAAIEGSEGLVSSPAVPEPIAVRYAFRRNTAAEWAPSVKARRLLSPRARFSQTLRMAGTSSPRLL